LYLGHSKNSPYNTIQDKNTHTDPHKNCATYIFVIILRLKDIVSLHAFQLGKKTEIIPTISIISILLQQYTKL